MKTQAMIETHQAERLARRLVKHWQHKFETEIAETFSVIQMPEAKVTFKPQIEHLEVEIDAPEAKMSKLQQVVLDHLIRMGQDDLSASWQDS